MAARIQARNGLLKGRRNQCRAWKRRALDWWTLKWIGDRGERCQALSKRRLTIDKTALSFEFVIHLHSLRAEKSLYSCFLEMLQLSEEEKKIFKKKISSWSFFYFTDYGRVGTKLLLNYWIHGDKVEIGPNSLSHDYLCPMTIWGLIKRSHCLHDWSKKKKTQMKIASLSWATTAFIYIFVRWVYPPLATPVRSTKLQNVGFFLRMADAH